MAPDEAWSLDGDRASCSTPFKQEFTQRTVVEVEIPFDDLRHLVLQYLRCRAILHLEQADDRTESGRFVSVELADQSVRNLRDAMNEYLGRDRGQDAGPQEEEEQG